MSVNIHTTPKGEPAPARAGGGMALTTVSDMVVSPRTGELLTLDSSIGVLGGFLADVREHEQALRDAKSAVQAEVLRRMDADGLWTVRDAGIELKGSSPDPSVEYDELMLRTALLALVDDGVITAQAVDRAVAPVVTYKTRKAGVNALLKLGGRVAETVCEHARPVEKKRYVTVTRSDARAAA